MAADRLAMPPALSLPLLQVATTNVKSAQLMTRQLPCANPEDFLLQSDPVRTEGWVASVPEIASGLLTKHLRLKKVERSGLIRYSQQYWTPSDHRIACPPACRSPRLYLKLMDGHQARQQPCCEVVQSQL